MRREVSILGTRGVPAQYGGFETCAERVALDLVEKGWGVTVYCQASGGGPISEDFWRGVRRVHVPVSREGPLGAMLFDWKSTLHAAKEGRLVLTLGYNTGIFFAIYRLFGVPNVVNMDGIEWKREKWGPAATAWLYLNERAACILANHLISDHPAITPYLATRVRESKITTIAYGADEVASADISLIGRWQLSPHGYVLAVARAQRDNQVLEIVRAFSARPRGVKLVVVGDYDANGPRYQQEVVSAAGPEVIFSGPIYDAPVLSALRFYCRLHIHGHKVGGTNPSLLEAMASGNPVLAHENPYNRWVAGDGAAYFLDERTLDAQLGALLTDESALRKLSEAGRRRHGEMFTWEVVLSQYEELLGRWHPRSADGSDEIAQPPV